jgi:hypothetical protein
VWPRRATRPFDQFDEDRSIERLSQVVGAAASIRSANDVGRLHRRQEHYGHIAFEFARTTKFVAKSLDAVPRQTYVGDYQVRSVMIELNRGFGEAACPEAFVAQAMQDAGYFAENFRMIVDSQDSDLACMSFVHGNASSWFAFRWPPATKTATVCPSGFTQPSGQACLTGKLPFTSYIRHPRSIFFTGVS